MRLWVTSLIVTIGVLALTTSAVLAQATAPPQPTLYCVSGFPNSAWVLIGLGFKVPPSGKCNAWIGFNPADGDNMPTNGVGCTSSDGSNLTLAITNTDEPGAFQENDAVSLALPAQTGEYVGHFISGSSVTSFGPTTGISGAPCSPTAIPAISKQGPSRVPLGSVGLP